ncbi:hypothetical protein FOL47_007054 [Perkinsus chesapeaki]|uniref:Uncharacterized protein n=1 Tax=Perkinsus chesapeaki TaxID=330153 RepID=A0A7J6LNH5_PERCH|nr:hypothetical protein FOL47_007054 [Perkinsus chesapeaki]
MPSTTPSLFYSASGLPDQMGPPSEVRDWEQLSQYIPQVLSPISPPLCTLVLRILVIANKLAEHQLSYIDQMGCDTAAQWDVFPNVIKCIVDEIALLAKRESQRPYAKTCAVSVQTSESTLPIATTTRGVQSESVSTPQPAPRDKTIPTARDSSLDLNLPRLMRFRRDGVGVPMGESPGVALSRTDRRTQTLVWGDVAYDATMPSPARRYPTRKVSVQTDEIVRINASVSCTILDGLDAPDVPPVWFVEAMGDDLRADDGESSNAADIDEHSHRNSITEGADGDYVYENISGLPSSEVAERSAGRLSQSEDASLERLPASPQKTETLGFVDNSSPEYREENSSPRYNGEEREQNSIAEAIEPTEQPPRQMPSVSDQEITGEDGIAQSESYLDTATAWFNSLWAAEGGETPAERRPSTSTTKSESRFSYRSSRRPSQQQASPDISSALSVAYVPLPSSPIRRRRNRQ